MMKIICNMFAVVCCFMFMSALQAQQISSIVISPAQPDDNDTITFYITCTFPNGACEGTAYASQTGNTIYASSLHCMGALTVICTDTDTITILPQAAGNYSFIYTLSAGFGSFPCSPGIVPNDQDTLNFTVSSTAGIHETGAPSFSIAPNPAHSVLYVRLLNTAFANGKLEITDLAGRVLHTHNEIPARMITLNLSRIENGTYLITLTNEAGDEKETLRFLKTQ